MREIRTSGLMSGEGKRDCANGLRVIDYVIVHELAHLIEGNHTPRFWSIVRAKSPMLEKARAWLKEHGQFLEQEV
jgi:predicted metal-dependent hydrolase